MTRDGSVVGVFDSQLKGSGFDPQCLSVGNLPLRFPITMLVNDCSEYICNEYSYRCMPKRKEDDAVFQTTYHHLLLLLLLPPSSSSYILCSPFDAFGLLSPGMMIRPKGPEALEIIYNTQRTESWDLYAQALDKFLGRESGLRFIGQMHNV